MEGMSSGAVGSTAAATGSSDSSSTGDYSSNEGAFDGGAETQGGEPQSVNQPPKGNKSVKQQVKELGDQDMDATVKLKVNGEVKTMSVREAVKLAQLEQAGRGKMEEAAKVRKQAQSLMEFAKSNPKEFFKQLGMDPYEFAEATLAEKLEMIQMTPEQKRIRELEEKAKRYEDLEKEKIEKDKQEKLTQEEQRAMQAIDAEMTEAFKESGLPKHPFYIQQVAAALLAADNQGHDLTAKEAAAMIKNRFQTHTREIFESLDADAIRELLGDPVLKKLRQAEVQRITGQSAPTANSGSRPATAVPGSKNPQNKSNAVNERGWKQYLESLKTGG